MRLNARNDTHSTETKIYYTIIGYRSITDAEAHAKYAKLVTPVIAQYGGKVLVRWSHHPVRDLETSALARALSPSSSPAVAREKTGVYAARSSTVSIRRPPPSCADG
ncbi:DUF1330 domain-containing protein [Bradyrhizobium sp. AUGA SZCCT0240]|uniref:DUF1330 domain-containing protein n=1 Tax=unclassified Bradyrhizobium TaxID=2631580 RepID=UPI001BAC1010|nr:DUF1330 domain-containing protein [Bradyrhizobium sp. AUGA SZCCT0160]MBR1199990.1 DUF1330 domain-containing protein [Bradyrhizobium sp. AUGA SZCCT0158]MBR1244336.1 DUF1330 domain-containing protein [Bradyrhizobium sp. AUGA SZCCT0274]MBR1258039.1 DUF1330 domain-containing protein [Bradyrhizobium sp. AUGA SZCCT0240]